MIRPVSFTRRQWFATVAVAGALQAATRQKESIVRFLEGLKRPGGGYGWPADDFAHLTPTFGVIACYRLLGESVPDKQGLAAFIRSSYPMLPARHKDRPLRRFDFEQIQALKWLGDDAADYIEEVREWTGPSVYTTAYEHEGYPVFQHEVMAILCRSLLGITDNPPAWRDYVFSRRRPDGTFNSTPAATGTGGHVMNTLWGLQALEALGERVPRDEKLIAWLRACQRPNGGFTYQPKPEMGGVDDVAYTWAALRALEAQGAKPSRPGACGDYIDSLRNADGGYGDRPGLNSNATTTMYALDALRALGREPSAKMRKPAPRRELPSDLKVFTMQIEAPGNGSPAEAVELAKALRIHLWAAKNAPAGWVERCQKVADERDVTVRFLVGNEEYGSYQAIPGLGSPSHLSDLIAPAGSNFGAPMNDPKKVVPWPVFRDQRIGALRKARGSMIWQFNENEELTRVLLDEAVETGTYSAVSSFHFGNENFLETQPFLMRYHDVLPFVALQDAHTAESWWWGDQLAGFRTVFLAKEPTYEAWLEALREKRVMAIRHDAISGFKTRLAGGGPEVRKFVFDHQDQWRWWGEEPATILRPAASLIALRPGDTFEAGVPESGIALRLRCLHENTTQGLPKSPLVELAGMTVDGSAVNVKLVEKKNARGIVSDRYYLYELAQPAPGQHVAEARLRRLDTKAEMTFSVSFSS
jgi:hypothetical protein